jgi:PAS domain S-box-containing protein
MSMAGSSDAQFYLGAIVASSDDAIVGKDLDGIIRSWNPGAERLFGYTAEEVLGRSIRIIIPADHQHEEDEVLRRIRSGQRVDHFETVRQRKDGSLVSISLSVSPVHGQDGTIIGASKIARDITSQKWTQAQLTGERKALELLMHGAPLPAVLHAITEAFDSLGEGLRSSILLLDRDGVHLRHGVAPSLPENYNAAIDGLEIGAVAGSCGTAAFRRETVIVSDIARDPLWAVVPEIRDLALECGLRACWSTPILSLNGRVLGTLAIYLPTSRSPSQAQLDFTAHMAFTAATIIERKQADELRAQLTAIVNSSNDAIYGIDLDGLIQSWNTGARQIYGYTEDQILGRPWRILIPPEELAVLEQYVALLKAGQDVPPFDTVRLRAGGQRVEVSVNLSPIIGEAGKVIGISSIARDITHRREVERLQREFLAMVTHELRNPLTSIRGFSSILRRTRTYDSEAVDTIAEQAVVLERLISDLLDASRVQVGRLDLERSRVDLIELAFSCARQVQATVSSHVVRIDTDVDQLEGNWDPVRIEQVLMNLLGNAVKYSNGGDIFLRLRHRDETAVIEVEDKGAGIAKEDLPLLFDRFYRVRGAGHTQRSLGLGLYITRAIVEMHGGRIWAESEGIGHGTTFHVELPQSLR